MLPGVIIKHIKSTISNVVLAEQKERTMPT
jgi:hypothetical protein